jgi:hypothetical protein
MDGHGSERATGVSPSDESRRSRRSVRGSWPRSSPARSPPACASARPEAVGVALATDRRVRPRWVVGRSRSTRHRRKASISPGRRARWRRVGADHHVDDLLDQAVRDRVTSDEQPGPDRADRQVDDQRPGRRRGRARGGRSRGRGCGGKPRGACGSRYAAGRRSRGDGRTRGSGAGRSCPRPR